MPAHKAECVAEHRCCPPPTKPGIPCHFAFLHPLPAIPDCPPAAPAPPALTPAGKPRRWDMVESFPSVAALLYHRTRQAVVLVRQFRPAVYVSARSEAAAAGRPEPPLAGERCCWWWWGGGGWGGGGGG